MFAYHPKSLLLSREQPRPSLHSSRPLPPCHTHSLQFLLTKTLKIRNDSLRQSPKTRVGRIFSYNVYTMEAITLPRDMILFVQLLRRERYLNFIRFVLHLICEGSAYCWGGAPLLPRACNLFRIALCVLQWRFEFK